MLSLPWELPKVWAWSRVALLEFFGKWVLRQRYLRFLLVVSQRRLEKRLKAGRLYLVPHISDGNEV